MLDKLLELLATLLRLPKECDWRKRPCNNLYWTLPENIVINKKGKMKPVCDLGLKTGPTCGGFFREKPVCTSYNPLTESDK